MAAARVYKENPEEVLVSVHSDHWMNSDKKFATLIRKSAKIASSYPDHTILIGIKPTYPETGYGYICLDKKVVQQKFSNLYKVKQFIEKPDLRRANKFVGQKKYLWNPGWFAWRVDHLLSLYKKHLRNNYQVIESIANAPARSFQRVVNKEFPKLKPATIDYGILERTKKRLVLPTDIGWTDIGHWRSVAEMSKQDKSGNVVDTSSVLLDSENNLFVSSSGKCITSIGVKNTVMIETDDVILLADKNRAQDVRQLVELIGRKKKLKKYL